jgi:hypothetical protein
MRKSILLICAAILSLLTHAQTYQVSFTGTGYSSTVDSVEILNLTQGTSMIVMGTDIVNFEIEDPTHIIQSGYSTDSEIQIFPNPMENSCNLQFPQTHSGLCQVSVIDVSGRIIANESKYLDSGNHTFRIAELTTASIS